MLWFEMSRSVTSAPRQGCLGPAAPAVATHSSGERYSTSCAIVSISARSDITVRSCSASKVQRWMLLAEKGFNMKEVLLVAEPAHSLPISQGNSPQARRECRGSQERRLNSRCARKKSANIDCALVNSRSRTRRVRRPMDEPARFMELAARAASPIRNSKAA